MVATTAEQAVQLCQAFWVEQRIFQHFDDLIGHPVEVEELALPSSPSVVHWRSTEEPYYVRLEPAKTFLKTQGKGSTAHAS